MTEGVQSEDLPEAIRERYRLRRRLGVGGMGEVVLADDLELDRQVAIKFLRRTADSSSAARFLREAQTLAEIQHPHVIACYGSGRLLDGSPFLILEYLEGTSLDFPPDDLDLREFVRAVADALHTVHPQGIIHRDLKPGNVFLTTERRIVLLDFGLVRRREQTALTATGSTVGTPAYLAPEALRGAPPTPLLDWYGLGATLYALLEGRAPFTTEEVIHLVTRHGTDKPKLTFEKTPADHPLAALARALMAENPNQRLAGKAAIYKFLQASPTVPNTLAEAQAGLDSMRGKKGLGATTKTTLPPRLSRYWALSGWLFLLCIFGGWMSRDVGPEPGPVSTEPEPATPLSAPAAEAMLAKAGLVPMPRNAQGRRRFRNLKDDATLVFIPGGTFSSRASFDTRAPGPEVSVRLPPFLVDEDMVSVARYRRWLEITGGRAPQKWNRRLEFPEHPTSWMRWDEARAYCAWAGGRLIRTREWERLASSTDRRTYPWGEEPPSPERAHYGQLQLSALSDPQLHYRNVGATPGGDSADGIHDLTGNAGSWTDDLVAAPYLKGESEPGNVGVSMVGGADGLKAWFRRTWPRRDSGSSLGLRLARDVSPELAAALVAAPIAPQDPLAGSGLIPRGRNAHGYREFDSERDGGRFILVPAGPFYSQASTDPEVPGPGRALELPDLLVDKYAVSVTRFQRFLDAIGLADPRDWPLQSRDPSKPVIFINWAQAREYATWARSRLIQVDEWERASGGLDGRRFPWGWDPPTPERSNFGNTDFHAATLPIQFLHPADSYPRGASPIGARNMMGNLECWSGDYLPEAKPGDKKKPASLGASFFTSARSMATWYRRPADPESFPEDIGIRLVRDVPPGIHASLDPRTPPAVEP